MHQTLGAGSGKHVGGAGAVPNTYEGTQLARLADLRGRLNNHCLVSFIHCTFDVMTVNNLGILVGCLDPTIVMIRLFAVIVNLCNFSSYNYCSHLIEYLHLVSANASQ